MVREKLPFLSSVKYARSAALDEKEMERVVVAMRHEPDEREVEHSPTESVTEGERESTKTVVEVADDRFPAASVA